MDRDDGIDDEIAALVRTAVTVGALMAEQLARTLETRAREAQAASEQQRAEYEARIAAERSAARAQLQPVLSDRWWTRTSPERIGSAYETAAAWAHHDELADRAATRIRDEVQRRYGVDVDTLAADSLRSEREIAASKTVDQLTPNERRVSYLDAQRWLSEHEPELAERLSLTVLGASTEAESVVGQNDAIEEHRRRRDHDKTAAEAAAAAARQAVIDEARADAEREAAIRAELDERRAVTQEQAIAAREARIAEERRANAEHEAKAAAERRQADMARDALAAAERWEAGVARDAEIAAELQSQAADVVQTALGQIGHDLRLAHWYDVADRRRALARKLSETGQNPDSITARMLVDASNAHPPEAAVRTRRHPAARRTRTARDVSRGQETGR